MNAISAGSPNYVYSSSELPFREAVQKPEHLFLNQDSKGRQFLTDEPGLTTFTTDSLNNGFISPTTTVPATFAGGQVQFRFQRGVASEINYIILEIQVSETGGANAVTPAIAPYLINYIYVGINGSATGVQIIYNDNLYTQLSLYRIEQISGLLAFNALNMTSTAYAAPTSIVASGTATYYLPLALPLYNKVNAMTINSDLILTVYLPNSAPVVAGTGVLGLTAMNARLLSMVNPQTDGNRLMLYRQFPYVLPFTMYNNVSITQTLTAGVLSSILLQSGSFSCFALMFMIRASKSYTSSGIYTFTALGGTNEYSGYADIVTAGKASLYGAANGFPPAYMRGILPASCMPGDFFSKVPIYLLPFSEKPAEAAIKGTMNGGFRLTGTEFLNIQPGTGFSSGTYTIDIYLLGYGTIEQKQDGFFNVLVK